MAQSPWSEREWSVAAILGPTTDREMAEFCDILSAHLRQPVVRRYSGGKEIQAACGTLAGAG